jgi:hypothetical protein
MPELRWGTHRTNRVRRERMARFTGENLLRTAKLWGQIWLGAFAVKDLTLLALVVYYLTLLVLIGFL